MKVKTSGDKKSKKKISKKKIRIALVIVAFLALLGAAGYTVFVAPLLKKEQWVYKEYVVQKGNLAVGVTESGSLEYGITELNYSLDLKAEDDEDDEEETEKYLKVEEVYVTSGGRIQGGDQLVRFSAESIAGVRRQLESALVEAKTDYNEALSDYDIAVMEADLEYESSLIDSKYARSIYQNSVSTISGDITTLKLQLQECKDSSASLLQKLEDAQDGYDEITAKYQEAKALWESMDVNDTVNFMAYEKAYLNAQSTYQNATDKIKQAQQAIEDNNTKISQLTRQITAASKASKIDQIEANETYQESILSGENAKVTYDSTIEGLKEDLQDAQKTLDDAQERLDQFEQFVGEEGILYATEEGIITEVSCEAGQSLERAQTLIAYAKPDEMTISVDVTQEDIINLSVGDKVNLTFTAYGDTPYVGSIKSIETTATSRNTDTVSYTVVVAVEGDTKGLYGGMTSDIVFVMEEKENVLYVSRKAIMEEDGKVYVYVKNQQGDMVKQEVKTGITNGVNTEIVEGLQEGDTVYLASKVSSEAQVTEGADAVTGDSDGGNGFGGFGGDGSMPSFDGMPDMENMPSFDGMPNMENMPSFDGMPGGGSMPSFDGMPGGGSMPGGGNGGSGNGRGRSGNSGSQGGR